MIAKRLLCPARRRRVPARFSWLDQRLAREGYLAGAEGLAWALYLFLLAVADRDGLSYYADPVVALRLGCGGAALARARRQLCQLDLIAFQAPLYQVLALPEALPVVAAPPPIPPPPAPGRAATPELAREHLRRIARLLETRHD